MKRALLLATSISLSPRARIVRLSWIAASAKKMATTAATSMCRYGAFIAALNASSEMLMAKADIQIMSDDVIATPELCQTLSWQGVARVLTPAFTLR